MREEVGALGEWSLALRAIDGFNRERWAIESLDDDNAEMHADWLNTRYSHAGQWEAVKDTHYGDPTVGIIGADSLSLKSLNKITTKAQRGKQRWATYCCTPDRPRSMLLQILSVLQRMNIFEITSRIISPHRQWVQRGSKIIHDSTRKYVNIATSRALTTIAEQTNNSWTSVVPLYHGSRGQDQSWWHDSYSHLRARIQKIYRTG